MEKPQAESSRSAYLFAELQKRVKIIFEALQNEPEGRTLYVYFHFLYRITELHQA